MVSVPSSTTTGLSVSEYPIQWPSSHACLKDQFQAAAVGGRRQVFGRKLQPVAVRIGPPCC
eukprot:1442790-Alexandrium_andersonii.AAC.1